MCPPLRSTKSPNLASTSSETNPFFLYPHCPSPGPGPHHLHPAHWCFKISRLLRSQSLSSVYFGYHQRPLHPSVNYARTHQVQIPLNNQVLLYTYKSTSLLSFPNINTLLPFCQVVLFGIPHLYYFDCTISCSSWFSDLDLLDFSCL